MFHLEDNICQGYINLKDLIPDILNKMSKILINY
jgi:hypothetical protein